jgi:Lrp/AsnC family transcriptional regulator, leucine-responsive regulatory protein
MDAIDDYDRAILDALQQDGRIANAELARRLNLSPPAIHARLRRLEEAGLIARYAALLDREKLGFDLLCFVNISLQRHTREHVDVFRDRIRELPNVLECHHVTGEYDYLLKVVVRNRKELEHLLMEELTPIPGVAHIHTSLVLNEIKAATALPLDS